MNPIRSRRSRVSAFSDMPERSEPPIWTSPLVGRSSPAATCSSVLLPEPDGPMMAVNVPGANAAVTLRSACTGSAPRP